MAHKIVQTGLLLCLFFKCLLSQCPPESMFAPCKCAFYGMYECSNIYDLHVLDDVFERSADRAFRSFNLTESTLMYLPAYAVTSKKMEYIQVKNCNMEALFDSAPTIDNKVNAINLYASRFRRGVDWTLFKNLKSLKYFTAHYTEIRLGKPFVENISVQLESISIRDCKVRKVHPKAFQNLKNLISFEMSNSTIKEWKRSMFATPSLLYYLYLRGNQIEFLPADMFSDMNMLKYVRLEDNRISTFSEAVFGNLFIVKGRYQPRIKLLVLNGNPIKCDCSIRWYIKEGDSYLRLGKTLGFCASPDDKIGESLEHLQLKEFNYCTTI